MALPELLAVLEREAETLIAAEREAARTEATAIVAASEARLARRREEALQQARGLLRAESEQRWSLAARAAERSILESREALLARVLGRVRERLRGTSPPVESDALLTAMLLDALAYSGSEPAEVRTSPSARTRVGQALAAHPGVTVTPDASVGTGSVVVTDGGRVTVDASMAGRLAGREAEARIEILRQFAARGGAGG